MWGRRAVAPARPAAKGLLPHICALAALGLVVCAAAPLDAQAPDPSPRAIDGQLPSFLGADTLRALEAAGNARNKQTADPKQPARAEPARKPAAAPSGGTEQAPPADEPLAAAEAEAKRRADERMRQLTGAAKPVQPGEAAATSAALAPSPPPVGTASPPAAAQAPTPSVPAKPAPPRDPASEARKPSPGVAGCGAPRITAEAAPAGRVRIAIAAPCQKGTVMRLAYGIYVFERPLDAEGEAVFLVDLFQGAGEAITVGFGDGEPQAVTLPATDLERVSKVAIAWKAPVNLDLHAYAYAADERDPGHVWAEAPASAEAALAAAATGQGRGFMSSADDGRGEGTKVEVYTFVHGSDEAPGTVALAVDYESRGATPGGDACGDGKLASVPFDIIVVERGRITTRESVVLGAAPCGITLAAAARYARSAVPELRIRK